MLHTGPLLLTAVHCCIDGTQCTVGQEIEIAKIIGGILPKNRRVSDPMKQSETNFRHLYYFWVVAKEGGVTRAAERLGLAVQTIAPSWRSWNSRWARPCSA